MKPKTFTILLISITLLGLILRLNNYTQSPPIDEAFDEVHYAWGGLTWLTNGIPKSWSWFNSYKTEEHIFKFGVDWRIVSPLIEKPPLYFLASGVSLTLLGEKEIYTENYGRIRLLPIALATLSIFLIGILTKKVFSETEGLLAALIYATTPFIVLANRMSVAENLLIPLSLGALILLTSNVRKKGTIWLIAILSGLSFLTKQAGISVAVAASSWLWIQKRRQDACIVIILSSCAIGLYFLFGYFYDWHLFRALQSDVLHAHTFAGLPEVFANIFHYPTISIKTKSFLDGTMLVGFLLLVSAPMWLKNKTKEDTNHLVLLFPFTYMLLIILGESGSTPYTYWGWYIFPLFPFVTILLAHYFYRVWNELRLLSLLVLFFGLGSSTIRFMFLFLPRTFQHRWQYMLLGVFVVLFTSWLSGKSTFKRIVLRIYFIVYIAVNIFVSLNTQSIYP